MDKTLKKRAAEFPTNSGELSDANEINEWREAVASVIAYEGTKRVDELLGAAVEIARHNGASIPFAANTAYINTIPAAKQAQFPGDVDLERRIRTATRWNALSIVMRANRKHPGLGGHIASFLSATTLYDVGFNHFWHAETDEHGGDIVFLQGHSSPGVYARAYLEGRLTEAQLDNFRQETGGDGLSSYPHPWLMPDFWQFPTVSMGLGPLMAIYQARFLRYLHGRKLLDTSNRKVWAIIGDGEVDEPETLGAISLAGREKLDNLVFVINCNLQRLDGPVRGNGKIVQELESDFRGAGWNVIKCLWGTNWDELLERDTKGRLRQLMDECLDGDYQDFKSKDGAYVRENFFGRYPETAEMVADWDDDRIFGLTRGGLDYRKVYAAYHAAYQHKGQPTVILAKTIKGFGMGASGEARNITHQQKSMDIVDLRQFCKRFRLARTEKQIESLELIKFSKDSPEYKYMQKRRKQLGGSLPARRVKSYTLKVPDLESFASQLKGTDGREVSTTMAFVRILNTILRDKNIGKRVVPIVPDESRTFGMEAMFRQYGIFSQQGQLYRPEDADKLTYYREDQSGQMLQEGICEAGGMSSWIAAATAYSTSNFPMIPFFIFYSMFGFQRVADLAWAAGDARSCGFLLGATAGRTTLNGEGLQHQDGHSHVISASVPNCVSYDPAYAYELAVIIQNGLHRMYAEQEEIYYYITLHNENYAQPEMPKGVEEGIVRGIYRLHEGKKDKGHKVHLLGSGTILRESLAAAELLEKDFAISADVWSVTSFTELRRDAIECERWNLLHPEETPRQSYLEKCLSEYTDDPKIASTDYVRLYADQIRPYIQGNYKVLGTDGFGRSDTRKKLRDFFEIDRRFIALAALKSLAEQNKIPSAKASDAIKKYGIDPNKADPSYS